MLLFAMNKGFHNLENQSSYWKLERLLFEDKLQ